MPGLTERDAVHLVGSVPLAGPAEVFALVDATLGDLVRRVPDGETGDRAGWIRGQYHRLAASPDFEVADPERRLLRLRPGRDPATARLPRLGYADAAVRSYRVLRELRAAGRARRDHRFQVSLPTALAPIVWYFSPADQPVLLPRYRDRLLDELRAVLAAVPHHDLAVQWDVAIEFALLEEVVDAAFEGSVAALAADVARLADQVPAGVECGFHLCYGDSGHRHFREPADTVLLARFAAALLASTARRVDWLHLPVPRERRDQGYFDGLRDLPRPPGTRLYLGLVHYGDGLEGTMARAEAAAVARPFGIATECGWGRRPVATIPALAELHARVARELLATGHGEPATGDGARPVR